jgi:CRP-like cAMP-binding protein
MSRTIDDFLSENVELLSGVAPETIRRSASAAERRELADGEYLFREGDQAEFMFVVELGSMEAIKDRPSGESARLRIMGPGESGSG